MSYDQHVHDGFRVVGLTGDAINHRHTPYGFAWLCGFNGITSDRAPWQWRYASNATMRDYIDGKARGQ